MGIIEKPIVKVLMLKGEKGEQGDVSLSQLQTEINARKNADNNLQSQIDGLTSGTPLVASSVAGMTDTSRIYVNTTDGNWYYYNGSNWVIGGEYQAPVDSLNLDKLENLTELNGITNLFSIDDLELGAIVNGQLKESTIRARSKDYIEINALSSYRVIVKNMNPDWYISGLNAYDENYNQIAAYEPTRTGWDATISANTKYIKFIVRNVNNATITDFNVFSSLVCFVDELLITRIQKLENNGNDITSLKTDLSNNRFQKNSSFRIAGHRGDVTVSPENTIPAFKYAKQHGYEIIETDVRFTSDNVPVMIHNPSIDDVSDGTGNVSEMTFATIRTYDFGSYKDQSFAGTKIPSLEETLQFCKGVNLAIYLELKTTLTDEQAQIICNLIKKYNMQDNIIFSSDNIVSLTKVTDILNIPAMLQLTEGWFETGIQRCLTQIALGKRFGISTNQSMVTSTRIETAKSYNIFWELGVPSEKSELIAIDPYISGIVTNNSNAKQIIEDYYMEEWEI